HVGIAGQGIENNRVGGIDGESVEGSLAVAGGELGAGGIAEGGGGRSCGGGEGGGRGGAAAGAVPWREGRLLCGRAGSGGSARPRIDRVFVVEVEFGDPVAGSAREGGGGDGAGSIGKRGAGADGVGAADGPGTRKRDPIGSEGTGYGNRARADD